MIIEFSLFEKLGINDLVIKISERAYKQFLKHYDKNKFGEDVYDEFKIDVSDAFETKELGFRINYNIAYSRGGDPIFIGVVNRDNNNKAKNLDELKSDIFHEVEHMVYVYQKYGKLVDLKGFTDDKHRFFDSDGPRIIFSKDLIGSFEDSGSNVYGMKASVQNFMKCDSFSDTYKKLIVYLYLGEQDEMSARIHEFFSNIKTDFKKQYNETTVVKYYKDMVNFKIDLKDLTKQEKRKIFIYVTPEKNIKKLEKYVNMQGQKFIKKIHKLSYFQDPEP